jgi:hypothetical protein
LNEPACPKQNKKNRVCDDPEKNKEEVKEKDGT